MIDQLKKLKNQLSIYYWNCPLTSPHTTFASSDVNGKDSFKNLNQ